MPYSARFGLLLLATLGCTPESHASDPIDSVPGGAGGSSGAIGAGGAPGAGGAGGAGGTAGSGFTTLSGVDPATPLDQLTGAQLVQACNEFAQYFSNQVPNADIV